MAGYVRGGHFNPTNSERVISGEESGQLRDIVMQYYFVGLGTDVIQAWHSTSRRSGLGQNSDLLLHIRRVGSLWNGDGFMVCSPVSIAVKCGLSASEYSLCFGAPRSRVSLRRDRYTDALGRDRHHSDRGLCRFQIVARIRYSAEVSFGLSDLFPTIPLRIF